VELYREQEDNLAGTQFHYNRFEKVQGRMKAE